MGLMQRRKGRSYEQRIANVLRDRWPHVLIRRASQADRAAQSDIYVARGDARLESVWWELTDSLKPDPKAKLEQAERDIEDPARMPVVIWHRYGERESHVTTRLWVLDALRGKLSKIRIERVSMTLGEFLDVVDGVRAEGVER